MAQSKQTKGLNPQTVRSRALLVLGAALCLGVMAGGCAPVITDNPFDPETAAGALLNGVLGSAVSGPEINVQVNSADRLSGTTHDFGSVVSGSSGAAVTFTIQNLGTQALNLTGTPVVVLSGTNQAEFTVNQTGVLTAIDPGATTTFTVTFSPTSIATGKTAAIALTSNDSDEGTYTITFAGAGTATPAAEINIHQGGTNRLTGSTHDFGSVQSGSSSGAITFTIENLGGATLNLTSGPAVIKSGANSADFTVVQPGSTAIAGSGTTTFTISFNPSAVGVRNAAITIANDDADEGSYVINLQGTGTAVPAPEINVHQGGTNRLTGSTHPFGNVGFGSSTGAITFTIENLGNATLNLTSSPAVIKSGTNAADFTIVQPGSTAIAGSGTTTFTINFTPGAEGARSAAITIANDDGDEGSYVINLSGTGTDVTAPSAISTLATGTIASTSVVLNWTAVGDNAGTGTATSYEIRYATGGACPFTDGNFGSTGTVMGSPPAPAVAGTTTETKTVTGLTASTQYWFAIKVSDEVPNVSTISNCVTATTTAAVTPVASNTILAQYVFGTGTVCAGDYNTNNDAGAVTGISSVSAISITSATTSGCAVTTSPAATYSLGSSSWAGGNGPNPTKYHEFTFNLDSGYSLAMGQLTANFRVSNTAPSRFAVYLSTNSYASAIGSTCLMGSSVFVSCTFDLTGTGTITGAQTVTVRIAPSDDFRCLSGNPCAPDGSTATSAAGTVRIDDVIIKSAP